MTHLPDSDLRELEGLLKRATDARFPRVYHALGWSPPLNVKDAREALFLALPSLIADLREARETLEMTGKMWSAGRGEFVHQADRFAKVTRYEEGSIIADSAPKKIWDAMMTARIKELEGKT